MLRLAMRCLLVVATLAPARDLKRVCNGGALRDLVPVVVVPELGQKGQQLLLAQALLRARQYARRQVLPLLEHLLLERIDVGAEVQALLLLVAFSELQPRTARHVKGAHLAYDDGSTWRRVCASAHHEDEWDLRLRHPREALHVDLGGRDGRIHEQEDRHEGVPIEEVVLGEVVPLQALLLGHLSVAIPWEVHQVP